MNAPLRRSLDNFPEKREHVVFFDFDNTLTEFDVLDSIIQKFSINTDWIKFENDWQAGRIGSKQCLEGQLQSLRVTQQTLSEYLSEIKLDPHFKKLLIFFKDWGIKTLIVSDSFSFFIREILNHHGIDNVPVYANELEFRGDQLIPSFPFLSADCSRCAHCKKRHVLNAADKITVYVGDGLSDICPAEHADIVFAKGRLSEHFKERGRSCINFESLLEVQSFFEQLEI